MNLDQLTNTIYHRSFSNKTFSSFNFGCRVNAAETNLLSQLLLNLGYKPIKNNSSICLVNTCSITKKGETESIGQIKRLSVQYPDSLIIATGCANLSKVKDLKNVITFDNKEKEEITQDLNCAYTPLIKDKFSHTHRYLLKVQSGCTQCCSYCTVPYKRSYLWSLPIEKAVQTVNQAIDNGYTEVIITGVNLDQYTPGFSNLLETLLTQTHISLISFGSIPVNCIDDKFLSLITCHFSRIANFLHIPIQSGSDKILKLMNRPYNKQKVIDIFNKLKKLDLPLLVKGGDLRGGFEFGTDIIVGFPGETEADLQETYDLCQSIDFSKIHTFKFSPRPNTLAKIYHQKYPKITKEELKSRSLKIRSMIHIK